MAPILHDPSFVVIPFLQLEIGLNGELYKDGIDIKNNILQIYVEEFPIIQNVTIDGVEKTKIKNK